MKCLTGPRVRTVRTECQGPHGPHPPPTPVRKLMKCLTFYNPIALSAGKPLRKDVTSTSGQQRRKSQPRPATQPLNAL